MIRKAFAISIVFTVVSVVCQSQTELIANTIKTCDNSQNIESDSSIQYPNSKKSLHLPKNWTGKFEGELPMLIASTEKDSNTFSLRAFQAWDVYSKDELFEIIKKDHPEHNEFDYLNHHILIHKTEGAIGRYELYFHVDESKESENSWMWHFVFYIRSIEQNTDLICQLNYLLLQFIKGFD